MHILEEKILPGRGPVLDQSILVHELRLIAGLARRHGELDRGIGHDAVDVLDRFLALRFGDAESLMRAFTDY
ncbi:MAG: hypothetical protein M3R40_09585 [Pseudomonadota bacterium]|nr:hypothetical protein [Pseudomonadota bacterium]